MLSIFRNIVGKRNEVENRMKDIQQRDPKLIIRGTLNLWTETGMEDGFSAVIALSEDEAKKNNGEQLYHLSGNDKFAVLDLEGNLVFDRGAYLVEKHWEHPKDVGPCRGGLHYAVQDSDVAYWCKHNFGIIIFRY